MINISDFINENRKLLDDCINDYYSKKANIVDKMYAYCISGDTEQYLNYKINRNRTNLKVKTNFIKKFINEETSYLLSNEPTLISKSGNDDIVNYIKDKFSSISKSHNKKFCRNLLSFGTAYEFYNIEEDSDGNIIFKVKNGTRHNSYVLVDENDNIILAMRFFTKPFDTETYLDIYTNDFIYHADKNLREVLEPTPNIFGEVPVSVINISEYKEYDTLFNELSALQDAYCTNLSDIVNEISDYRLAYLIMTGVQISEEKNEDGKSDIDLMKENGIIVNPNDNARIDFLTKNINDTFIHNTLETLRKNIYEISSHVDTNEKLQSNTSGSALRNRLIGLEQRVRNLEGCMHEVIIKRIKFMFKLYRILEGIDYNYKDIEVKFTLNIPQDDLLTAQTLSQLGIGENISLKTALSRLSFIDNPAKEIQDLQEEKLKESQVDYLGYGTTVHGENEGALYYE